MSLVAIESVRPQTPSTQWPTSNKSGLSEELPIQPSTSSSVPRPYQASLLTSSPPPPASMDENKRPEQRARITTGAKPDRKKLTELMGAGVASDRSKKMALRKHVKNWVLGHVDMSKPFSQYSDTAMVAIAKGCTKYMNAKFIPKADPWKRETVYHLIHSIFQDTRRNNNAREKSAAKRKAKRELEVSSKTSLSTRRLVPTNIGLNAAWICCKQSTIRYD